MIVRHLGLSRRLGSVWASGNTRVNTRATSLVLLKSMSQKSEGDLAAEAATQHQQHPVGRTIFDKIIDKEIPARIAYEDDSALAFHDVNPQAPVHILIIPKKRDGLTQLSLAESRHESVLGHLLYVAKTVAKQEKLDQGFRIVINDGPDGCQSVYHLHLHLMGGRKMRWPPG